MRRLCSLCARCALGVLVFKACSRCVLGVLGRVVAGRFWCSFSSVSLTQPAPVRRRASCVGACSPVQACAGVCVRSFRRCVRCVYAVVWCGVRLGGGGGVRCGVVLPLDGVLGASLFCIGVCSLWRRCSVLCSYLCSMVCFCGSTCGSSLSPFSRLSHAFLTN